MTTKMTAAQAFPEVGNLALESELLTKAIYRERDATKKLLVDIGNEKRKLLKAVLSNYFSRINANASKTVETLVSWGASYTLQNELIAHQRNSDVGFYDRVQQSVAELYQNYENAKKVRDDYNRIHVDSHVLDRFKEKLLRIYQKPGYIPLPPLELSSFVPKKNTLAFFSPRYVEAWSFVTSFRGGAEGFFNALENEDTVRAQQNQNDQNVRYHEVQLTRAQNEQNELRRTQRRAMSDTDFTKEMTSIAITDFIDNNNVPQVVKALVADDAASAVKYAQLEAKEKALMEFFPLLDRFDRQCRTFHNQLSKMRDQLRRVKKGNTKTINLDLSRARTGLNSMQGFASSFGQRRNAIDTVQWNQYNLGDTNAFNTMQSAYWLTLLQSEITQANVPEAVEIQGLGGTFDGGGASGDWDAASSTSFTTDISGLMAVVAEESRSIASSLDSATSSIFEACRSDDGWRSSGSTNDTTTNNDNWGSSGSSTSSYDSGGSSFSDTSSSPSCD